VAGPFRVDHREGMHRDEDLVTFTVDADGVIVVLVALVARRSELHVNVFGDARWYHSLFVVPNFKVGSLRRKHMKPLGCGRVIDQANFKSVGLASFETRKFDNSG